MKKDKRRTKRGSTNKPGRGPSDPTRPKLLFAYRISNKKRREMFEEEGLGHVREGAQGLHRNRGWKSGTERRSTR